MLAQLVCIDRRFQRMNCFNMRELQALLKQKFFPDFQSQSIHNNFFEKVSVGIKNKLGGEGSYNSNFMINELDIIGDKVCSSIPGVLFNIILGLFT